MDNLQFMLERQKEFDKLLQISNRTPVTETERFKIYTLSTIVELSEMLQETNWKPWKKYKEFDINKVRLEFIDSLCFMLHIANILKINSKDITELYCYKRNINIKRQNNAY